MEDRREFLEEQRQAAKSGVETVLAVIKDALTDFDTSFDDWVTWEKALEKFTRASDDPYHPPPLENPLYALLESRMAIREGAREVKQERPKREERPPAPKRFTKRGAVRDFIVSLDRRMDVGEVTEAFANRTDLQEPISRGDLYKILPSLYAKNEISRVKGKYGPPDFDDEAANNGFFKEDEEANFVRA